MQKNRAPHGLQLLSRSTGQTVPKYFPLKFLRSLHYHPLQSLIPVGRQGGGLGSRLSGLKTRDRASSSFYNHILIHNQISIIIESEGKGLQGTGWGPLHIPPLEVELPTMTWTQKHMVILVPCHQATQMRAAGGKGYKALFIAGNKELEPAMVEHLPGLIIVRETHLNRHGGPAGHTRPEKPRHRGQGGRYIEA